MSVISFTCVFYMFILFCFCATSDFVPTDNYLIDCGSSTTTSVDDRNFESDDFYKFLSTQKKILASTSDVVESPLYQSARIFTGSSKYIFPINQKGRHWIRFHFSPFTYDIFDLNFATFSIETQTLVLLSDFTTKNSVIKEYSINVATDTLVISFIPSRNSIAFVNAIEVVSVPDDLIIDDAQTINPVSTYSGLVDQAFETVWRVNMGGPTVKSGEDPLHRIWVSDQRFQIFPWSVINVSNISKVNYTDDGPTEITAPRSVYGTAVETDILFNETWQFEIDQGFQYFVRAHFCDIVSSGRKQIYINLYFNSLVAIKHLGLPMRIPYYKDLITPLADSNTLVVDISFSHLHKDNPKVILNGLEIMKINNSIGSLSAHATSGVGGIITSDSSSSKVPVIAIVVSAGVIIVLVMAGVCCTLCRKGKWNTWFLSLSVNNTTHTNAAANFEYREYPLVDIQGWTNHFDESRVIGVGGFGKVYMGQLSDGRKVAVKRRSPNSRQGIDEFQMEIVLLSQLRHHHLVSLIGSCYENEELILVYEYMENGTLTSHLRGSRLPSLSWEQRLNICIGIARGLHYLHTGCHRKIIHRDIKTTNILLDQNLNAKLSDFGISKTIPGVNDTHVTTLVRGTFGYMDSEYHLTSQLTEKADVYSFGVVLIEVLCGNHVYGNRGIGNLVHLAMQYQTNGQLADIIDPSLATEIKPDSLRMFGEISAKCLADSGADRPAMLDILSSLECALQLQKDVVQRDPEHGQTNNVSNEMDITLLTGR